MSQERDELVRDIMQHPWLVNGEFTGACPSCPDLIIKGGYNSPSHASHIADALLAAGYRKARVITTRAEQVNLPNGTVVVTRSDIFQHFNGYWFAPGSSYNHHLDELPLPLTVVHGVQP
ncbi:hypothetical protein [Arthrobacter sp. StoSoilB22]|uniref:hypothetical protein n=1 Tax=Arthrobacter sp. StoSoilB22 TaxID=2830996 RepID=UPI001CC6DB2C|nr:hypothetical protein [Arthrobacter sp. StoSoilB22]BCW61899.1 hypothetical protein StoSoilB22_08720 [Arthrobacter sp. StoSoilB22]